MFVVFHFWSGTRKHELIQKGEFQWQAFLLHKSVLNLNIHNALWKYLSIFCLSHNWSLMVVLKTEVFSAGIHPSHLLGECSCYFNFLPRFDNSIYLGEMWNRFLGFFCKEIQQMLNNCAFEKRPLAESLRLWNLMWWQLFVSRSTAAQSLWIMAHLAACA